MDSVRIDQKSYEMPPRDGFTVTHFLTVADIERSVRFYETVFGGRILSKGDSKGAPGYIQIANGGVAGPSSSRNRYQSTARRAATSVILTVTSSRSDRAPSSRTVDAQPECAVAFYRGRRRSDELPILAVTAAAEQPSPQSLRRLEHEFSLAKELDARWAAQPLALTRHQGRAVLILEDPGGEPLDRVVDRHKREPIDLTRFLRIAVGMTAALGHTHRQGVVHKDVKPANALVDDSGHVRLTGFGLASR